jgi:predicted GIY-YIG superfamily endonuclease
MPKVPIDYSKTIIYKLVHFDDLNDDNIYIGHTVNMTKRKHNHKRACCNTKHIDYNKPKYQYMRENGGWDNWQMIFIEKYPCNDVHEAIAREQYWRRKLNTTLNNNLTIN